ncbi:MAG: ABC transporter permease subunit, partial [Erysipelotrichaceae bacterium]
FMIIQIHSSLAKMDKAIINASFDLGANRFQTFTKIIFPLSLPGVISGITLVFLPAVSSFVIPKLLGGGQYVLVGNLIETQFISVGQWNFGSAISLVMAVIILISMYFTKRFDKDIEEEKVVGGK